MKLSHVKGNTYVIEGDELIPVYMLGGGRCVLMDTGLIEEREELDRTLQENRLFPAAVLCSHAHVDHCANNRYLQESYGTKVGLSAPEAGMCSHLLNLKCYRLLSSPHADEEEIRAMEQIPDWIFPEEDVDFQVEGAVFRVIQTPGHSSGHVAFVTPDNVCYVGDALMSRDKLGIAKLPYSLSVEVALESRRKLPLLGCDVYIMAHKGICSRQEIGPLTEDNEALVMERMTMIKEILAQPKNFSDVVAEVARRLELRSRRPRRGLYYERNIRFYIEYLLDQEEVEIEVRDGVVYYSCRS